MRPWIRPALMAAGMLLTALQHAAAQDASGNDLRDIRIGLSVADLPAAGYAGFSCAADANVRPSGWSGWRDCPAGADGLRALRFGYDPATSRDGTVVAGHPAVLTALIDKEATVAGRSLWRGHITHVSSRQKRYFLRLEDVLTFIAGYLPDADFGTRRGLLYRLRLGLKRSRLGRAVTSRNRPWISSTGR